MAFDIYCSNLVVICRISKTKKECIHLNIWTVLKIFLKINSLTSMNFFCFLKEKCISEKDYSQASNVWNKFKMNTMGDYHDLYLKTDVLLLTDLFEKFINTCLEYYGLDPCYYFSSMIFI